MNEIQWIATIFSIIYVSLAVFGKRICFIFGAIGCALIAYEDFTNLNLKFDGALQIFYVGMSIYGWFNWTNSKNNEDAPIKTLSLKNQGLTIISGLFVSIVVAWLCLQFFSTNLPYLDAVTTGFSIIATVLLAQKYIDNWYYWMIINPVYIYIYASTGASLFAVLMGIYAVMAVVGFINWRRLLANQ